MAPVPADGPSKVLLSPGSIFSHRDHASQLWKPFTCAYTAAGGAEMVALRTTRYSAGCKATMTRNTTTIITRAMRIFMSIGFLLLLLLIIYISFNISDFRHVFV